MDRLKGYIYALMLEYNCWSDVKKSEFLESARTRFESQKKYNLFRDELSESVKGYQPLTA